MSSFREGLFEDRSVVVVGGTSGIGAEIANTFQRHRARVRVAGLGEPVGLDAGIEVLEADVTEGADVLRIVDDLERLDVLVNCAGIIRRDAELDPDVFAEVLDVNLTGTMRTCVAARPLLAQSGGCVINMASMRSYFGGAMVPAYSASKGGIVQLTKSLAATFAADQIRVNAVAPGWIRTAMTGKLQQDAAESAQILERTPLARWGMPADVARAAVFLASPEASFITGVVLPVDGGYLAV